MTTCTACSAGVPAPAPSALRRAVMVGGRPAVQVFVEGAGAGLYRLGEPVNFGKLEDAARAKRRVVYDELVNAGLPAFAAYQFPEFAGA